MTPVILAVFLSWAILMFHRNQRVYKFRTRILDEDSKSGLDSGQWRVKKVSYEYMYWHFWVWDLNSFFNESQSE